jgi:predicted chitinase
LNKQYLLDAMNKGGITDPEIRAAMMAVTKGESGFVPKTEKDYSTTSNERIRSIFSRTAGMSDADLTALKQNPEAFFNTVYGNKLGNSSNEGYLYRGRGFFQLTGKANYERYGNMIGVDLVSNPDLANDPEIAAKIAVEYVKDRFAGAPGKDKREKVFRAVGNPVESTENVKNAAYSEYLQTGEFSPDKIAQIESAATGIKGLETLQPFDAAMIGQLDERLQKWYEKAEGMQKKNFEIALQKLGVEEFNTTMKKQPVNDATLNSISVLGQESSQYTLTEKLGDLTPQPRNYDPNRDDPGPSAPGEFNYSLSPAGIQSLGIADEKGRVTPASVEKNLVEIETNNGVKVKVHKSVAQNALGFLNELEKRGYPVRGADTGGYVYRTKSEGSGLSTHATGTTLDVNWQSNWGTFGAAGNIDFPPDVEKLANYYGFSWGAKFGDPMHFETMSPELHKERLQQLEAEGYIKKNEEIAPVTPPTAPIIEPEKSGPEALAAADPVSAARENQKKIEEEAKAKESAKLAAPNIATGGTVIPGEDVAGINLNTGKVEFMANSRERIRIDPAELENTQQMPTITREDTERLETLIQPPQAQTSKPPPVDASDPNLYMIMAEGQAAIPPSQIRATNRAKMYGETSSNMVNGHFA